MPPRFRKAAALLLAALLLVANVAADFAHRHDWHGERNDDPAFSQLPNKQPILDRSQKLCLACLFANAHHSLPNDILLVVNIPPSFSIACPAFLCFSPFDHTTYNNRAPPVAKQLS
jgi:hypothetical protein